MPNTSHNLMGYIRDVIGAWKDDPRSDAELMARFTESRDEHAFKVLVGRHGAMVWRTCRRILGNTPDAEDVFQSTFLALTRKAGLFPVKSLAGWLHRVTRQAALDIDASARRRRGLERRVQTRVQSEVKEDSGLAEQHGVLDEELAGLPEKLRVPLVLHFLEEKTQDEVARILGCSQSAVQRRLAKGEAILRSRLEQRGLALVTGSIAALFGSTSGAPAVPAGLIASTARAAVAFRAGTLTCVAAERAQKLLHSLTVEGGVRTSWWIVLASLCCLGIGGAGLVAWKIYEGASDALTPAAHDMPKTTLPETATKSRNERVDCFGDPLPEGALARIGTLRFRHCLCNMRPHIAFLPDGKTLVSVGGGGERGHDLYFWEWATGKLLRRLEGVGGSAARWNCSRIAVSPDAKMLACAGEYWDLSVDPPRRLKREPLKAVSRITEGDVAFSPDSKIVAWAVEERDGKGNWTGGFVYLVDASTGKVIRTLKDSAGAMERLAFSRDGKTLAPYSVALVSLGRALGIGRLTGWYQD